MSGSEWTLMVGLVLAVGWGQYWFDRAHRLMDAVKFMIEEEIDNG